MKERSSQSPSFSLLLVEDDRVTLEMLQLVLATKYPGDAVYAAGDGRAGIELFSKHTPGLVITDINMPVMNGIEMAQAIKAIRVDTQFIVLTAYSDRSYYEQFKDIGFRGYFLKPIEFKKLFALIDDYRAECA